MWNETVECILRACEQRYQFLKTDIKELRMSVDETKENYVRKTSFKLLESRVSELQLKLREKERMIDKLLINQNLISDNHDALNNENV